VIHKTQNCKPIANAGTDQVVPATAPSTEVTLDGSASSDPEGAALTYTWTGDFTEGTASGALATVHFTTLGAHTVTLVVNDGVQDSDPDEVVIELIDVTPPTIVVENLPISLWPPNHDLVRILPAVQVTDDFDDNPDVTLDITSNEADDGRGDGSTTGDSFVRSPSDFDLRAERAGPGGGRIYKLVWTATDDSGNTSTLTKYVVVPHDNGHPLPQPPADEPPPAPQPIGGTTSSDAPGLGAGSVGAASGNQGNGNGRGRGHAYGRGGKKKKAH
jgi:hypothetical protein